MQWVRRFFNTAPTLALAAIACGGAAAALGAAPGSPSNAERDLMIKASQSNIAEIEEGRLAMTNSKDPQVQALGNRLVQDHTKAEDTLEALAASMSVKLPSRPDPMQEQEIGKLESMKGAAFDRVFDRGEVMSHEKTIAEMQQAAANVHNPALRAWIAQNVPVLQEHLLIARGLPGASGSSRTAQAPSAGTPQPVSPR
jgi:putative membrane protein